MLWLPFPVDWVVYDMVLTTWHAVNAPNLQDLHSQGGHFPVHGAGSGGGDLGNPDFCYLMDYIWLHTLWLWITYDNMAMENGMNMDHLYRQLILAQHYNSLTQLCTSYFELTNQQPWSPEDVVGSWWTWNQSWRWFITMFSYFLLKLPYFISFYDVKFLKWSQTP